MEAIYAAMIVMAIVALGYWTLFATRVYYAQTAQGSANRAAYSNFNLLDKKIIPTFCWNAGLRILASCFLFEHGYGLVAVLVWYEFAMLHILMVVYNTLRFLGVNLQP